MSAGGPGSVFDALPVDLNYKWRRSIDEMIMTERFYVNELKIIMRGYIHVIPDNVLFSLVNF